MKNLISALDATTLDSETPFELSDCEKAKQSRKAVVRSLCDHRPHLTSDLIEELLKWVLQEEHTLKSDESFVTGIIKVARNNNMSSDRIFEYLLDLHGSGDLPTCINDCDYAVRDSFFKTISESMFVRLLNLYAERTESVRRFLDPEHEFVLLVLVARESISNSPKVIDALANVLRSYHPDEDEGEGMGLRVTAEVAMWLCDAVKDESLVFEAISAFDDGDIDVLPENIHFESACFPDMVVAKVFSHCSEDAAQWMIQGMEESSVCDRIARIVRMVREDQDGVGVSLAACLKVVLTLVPESLLKITLPFDHIFVDAVVEVAKKCNEEVKMKLKEYVVRQMALMSSEEREAAFAVADKLQIIGLLDPS